MTKEETARFTIKIKALQHHLREIFDRQRVSFLLSKLEEKGYTLEERGGGVQKKVIFKARRHRKPHILRVGIKLHYSEGFSFMIERLDRNGCSWVTHKSFSTSDHSFNALTRKLSLPIGAKKHLESIFEETLFLLDYFQLKIEQV